MQLTEFIQANHKIIIEDWVAFTRTLPPWAEGLDEESLRDHADELLTAVVSDMKCSQSSWEQSEKSKGNALDGALARIGQKHANDRLESGITLVQVVSEFRALRASVLRLWEKAHGADQDEMTRFNEAIDETLATSTARYSETVHNTREQFLGILGHDLRNPLGAITMGASLIAESDDPDNAEIAQNILKSAERMGRMVNDLLDLTRTRLGSGIPVACKKMELTAVCRQIISELQVARPNIQFQFDSAPIYGEWDSDRLSQVVSNLLANALQYGAAGKAVTIRARQDGDEVVLHFHNEGVPIPEKVIPFIFDPMARHRQDENQVDHNSTGLGLGLYIANEIVIAHGGQIAVSSSLEEGTTFKVTLPLVGHSKEDKANHVYERPRSPDSNSLHH